METHRRYVFKAGKVKRVGLRLFVVSGYVRVSTTIHAFSKGGAIAKAKAGDPTREWLPANGIFGTPNKLRARRRERTH